MLFCWKIFVFRPPYADMAGIGLDLLQVSLAEKTGEGKKRERLVILGMLINIHEQSSLASIFKNDGVVVNCFIEA